MQAEPFQEAVFYAAVASSGVRTLLIGRRAVIAWGVPVMTTDYDLWITANGAEGLNATLRPLDLFPNRTPEEARRARRYVLENGERVSVLLARSVTTVDGDDVAFEEVWGRRELLEVAADVRISVPAIDDLIRTKRFAARPKDAEDIRLLRALRESRR